MRLRPPRQSRRGPILDRLGRAAEGLNPLLIVIVIGLAILTFSVFAALELQRLPLG